MKLDVKSLVFAPVGDSESFKIELFKEKLDEEFIAERIRGNLTLTKLENELLGKFEGIAKVNAICDRCAGDFVLEVPLRFSQEYLLEQESGEEDKLTVSNHFDIEVTEPLRQEILTALPVKKLCQEDCAGICLGCGVNLNEGKCACRVTKSKKKI